VSNTSSSITVTPAFAHQPAVGDKFDVNTTQIAATTITNVPCTTASLNQNINDMLSVVVHTQAELPVGLPFLPNRIDVQNSSTVRYEGALVP
jgi:hypothetical protein